jgi:hypothetical protein
MKQSSFSWADTGIGRIVSNNMEIFRAAGINRTRAVDSALEDVIRASSPGFSSRVMWALYLYVTKYSSSGCELKLRHLLKNVLSA